MPIDPCGMVMDIGRTAYQRDSTFFTDDGRAIPIKWYRAPDTAAFFPFAHKWGSLYWYSFPWTATGVGENYGSAVTYSNGFTPPTALGTGFFGPAEYFRDGCKFDSTVDVPRDTWGLAKACAVPDCFILLEPAYNPIMLLEDGRGFEPEICT